MDNPFAGNATLDKPVVDLPSPPAAGTAEAAPDPESPVAAVLPEQKPRASRKSAADTPDSDPTTITGLAHDGRAARKPGPAEDVFTRSSRMRDWLESYEPLQVSPDDLDLVNKEIYTVSRAMTELEKIYSEVADMLLAAETRYSRARNRAALSTSGSTAAVRDAYADVLVEDLQLHAAELKVELTRVERAVRMTAKHLDALMGIGHNLRATMKV